MPRNEGRSRSQVFDESGNAFIIILVAVVLFIALAFTISRSMQSQTTSTLSTQQLDLAVSDILAFVQRLERAVDRVRSKGCSENDISFDNPVVTGYAYGTPPDKCKIFNKNGGGIVWQNPPDGVGASDTRPYVINGANKITGVGNAADNDLIALLTGVRLDICNKINEKLGISLAVMPPVDGASSNITAKFQGTFTGTDEIGFTGGGTAGFEKLKSACYRRGATYQFYHTILVR